MDRAASSVATRQGQSWVVLTLLFALANFLEVAVVAHFVLFTPAFLATIGFDDAGINAWTGPIASVGFLVGIWFVPFWGVLADRYGRKPLILRSYYVEVAAMFLAAISQNVWFYLIGRALTGFALGNTGLMYASLTEAAPRHRVALALGLVNGSAPLGSLIGAVVGGYVVSLYGVHWLFGLDAAVAAIIAVVLTVAYREPFVPRPTPHIMIMLQEAVRAIVQSPVASTLFVVSFIYNAAFFFSYTYLPVRIGQIVGEQAAPAAIGLTQGAAGATTLIGSALFGILADRWGHRRILALLLFSIAVMWIPMFAAQDLFQLGLTWAVFSMVNPSAGSIIFAIISLTLPSDKRASVLSMVYLPMNLAFILAPFLASFVATGMQVRDVFLVSASLSLVALLTFVANVGRTHADPKIAAH